MKEVFVGTFELGYERIRLYLRPGGGAGCAFIPDDNGMPIMWIGADQEKWRHIVGSLLHECQEFAMCRIGKSFYPSGGMNTGSSNCIFVLDHEKFDECCMRSGEFVASALPTMAKAWKQWKKPIKRRKKR
jgi:hypothetical protein